MSTAYEHDIEKLRKGLGEVIDLIGKTNLPESSFAAAQRHANGNQEKLEELTRILNGKLRTALENLHETVRDYFLYLFKDYQYSFANGSFKETLKKYILKDLLNDLKGIRDSFEAFNSAFQGHLPFLRDYLFKYPKYKDQVSIYGTTFLYSSSRNNHFDLVQYLIETVHCQVNLQNRALFSTSTSSHPTSGSTPLHAACFYGHLKIVEYLIAHGADCFIENEGKETPIDNGRLHEHIQQFFANHFVCSYNQSKKSFPSQSILKVNEMANDCIWEYRSLSQEHWQPFDPFNANQLQSYLQKFQIHSKFSLQINHQAYQINFLLFLASSSGNEEYFWLRSRGSSILNFNFYSKWQILFCKSPSVPSNSTSPLQFHRLHSHSLEYAHWYHLDEQLNAEVDEAMNKRQKILRLPLPFFDPSHLFTFNLLTFTFSNEQLNIAGQLRWIPLLLSKQSGAIVDNYPSLNLQDIELKYHQQCHPSQEISPPIDVRYGDIVKETSDAIVISWSSEYLMGVIYELGGEGIRKTIEKWIEKKNKETLISVPADGKIPSKRIFFLSFPLEKEVPQIERCYQNLVEVVLRQAQEEKLRSVSFSAIAFNAYKSHQELLSKTLVEKLLEVELLYQIGVSFVIEANDHHIYNHFQKYLQFYFNQYSNAIEIGNSRIEISKGDLTKEKVDVIIVSSTSEDLTQIVLIEAGEQVQQTYRRESAANPHSLLLVTSSGNLSCEKIFFAKLNLEENDLRQSIEDFISNVIQNVRLNQFQSLAFPLIGSNHPQISLKTVLASLFNEITYQIQTRNLSLLIKFVILPSEEQLYPLLTRELFLSQQNDPVQAEGEIPSSWESSPSNSARFPVSKSSVEYQTIEDEFRHSMKEKLKKVVQIERIQNERWFAQYLAHKKDFFKRLKKETERRVYHGCPHNCVDSIVEDCFNRSFAGVNGTAYGIGVYFSTDAIYSNQFAKANSQGEKCMFLARVLIGNSTIGNPTMKTRPPGFDTTTDGKHIFVTYHDAQAYAEYLITYK